MKSFRLSMLLVVLGLASVVSAAPKASKPAAAAAPKAADGKPAGSAMPSVPPSEMPPYFGMFGSADLIAKVGFRGSVGSYIEYRLDPLATDVGKHGLRLAQVAPEVPGARWIEMTAQGHGVDGSGLRVLTRGNGKGNVERIVAQSPQSPAMELPMSGVSAPPGAQAIPGGKAGSSLMSDVKHLGHEKIEVPLGKFETEHWLIAEKPRLEIWTTKDERVPFIGAVKMLTEEGYAQAVKVGTDATAIIIAPPERPK